MKNEVAEAIRVEMSKQIEQYTFTRSRGRNGTGVRDVRNFESTVEQSGDATVLRVQDIARFQSSSQGSKTLAEVVETGDPAFRMPGPRPFLEPTQREMDDGIAEKIVEEGLKKRGF